MGRTIIEINPAFEPLRGKIERMLRDTIAAKIESEAKHHTDKVLPDGAKYIYEGRNNLYRIETGNVPMIVKDFKKANLLNRYAYCTVRKSKAARSYLNALKMEDLGFKTPHPIAYCEYRRGIDLIYSFYVSEELTGTQEMRLWEKKPDVSTLLPAFAAEIVKLHRAGVWHKDFSPGNILYKRDKNGQYEFYYVDLNRMQFGVHDYKKQIRMLRSINLNMEETARIGRLYGEAAGLDPDVTAREALHELDGYLAERKKKARLKRR